jgi:hypothetical protein
MNKKNFSDYFYETIYKTINNLKMSQVRGNKLDLPKPNMDFNETHGTSGISLERTRLEEYKE